MDKRKTLMLSEENHARITSLADQANAPRHLVLDAILSTLDEKRVVAELQRIRAKVKVNRAEERKKRQMLNELTKDLDAGDLEALIKNLKTTAP